MSESEPEAESTVEEIEDSKEATFAVVDPDDYRKTKKLQAIQDSKEHFREIRRSRRQVEQTLKDQYSNWREAYRAMRAEAISDYATELIPLIEEGLRNETLSENDLVASLGPEKSDIDVRWVARNRGRIERGNETIPLPDANCGEVYRQLERIERKLGLGLELEENKGPAEI